MEEKKTDHRAEEGEEKKNCHCQRIRKDKPQREGGRPNEAIDGKQQGGDLSAKGGGKISILLRDRQERGKLLERTRVSFLGGKGEHQNPLGGFLGGGEKQGFQGIDNFSKGRRK